MSVNQQQRMQSIRKQMSLEIKQSAQRQTADNSFGTVVKRGAAATVNTMSGVVSPFSPRASAVLSAAVNTMGTAQNGNLGGAAVAANASVGAPGLGAGTGAGLGAGTAVGGSSFMNNVAGRAEGGDAQSQMFMATRELQELNQGFNLQYLMLQQDIQAENRKFTALTNVMKNKHDTSKTTLSNIK